MVYDYPPRTVVGEEGDSRGGVGFWVVADYSEFLQPGGELLNLLVEVVVGEDDFWFAVGVVEGHGLTEALGG